jgi:hypothetical protein
MSSPREALPAFLPSDQRTGMDDLPLRIPVLGIPAFGML